MFNDATLGVTHEDLNDITTQVEKEEETPHQSAEWTSDDVFYTSPSISAHHQYYTLTIGMGGHV